MVTTADTRAATAVKNAVARCQKKYGSGWEWMSDDQRRCAVASVVMAEFATIDPTFASGEMIVATARAVCAVTFEA